MKKWILFLSILATIFLLAACGNGSNEESQDDNNDSSNSEETSGDADDGAKSLQLMENDKVGNYLADSEGMTLYYFTKDEEGTSNCSGKCLENWPAFTAQDFDVPEGFNKDNFSTITREDTEDKQVTYKGYPLYYFVKDKAKGDVNGQGKKDVWYTVNSETTFDKAEGENASSESASLQIMENDKVGNYLADSEGMTLYYFTKDEEGTSNCSGKCLENWPAFTTQDFDVPEGFNKDNFSTITREDTEDKQVTYKGYPLYYFVKDKAKGDVNGQGKKDVWYTVNSETAFK
ncbi:hypothetical protein GCM10008983_06990 [Lentibacillus halophilus]|uniref:Lipoprotein with Yx(FWY)xxD motif n=1 Tax=Lentibacillus halophilus TaxID=295065 RepID=A0ABN0Z4G2_9BACI